MVGNDFLADLATPGLLTLHGFYDTHAFSHLPKTTLAMKPTQSGRADEKLDALVSMDKMPGPVYFRMTMPFSSSNFSPWMDLLPVQ